MAGPEPKSDRAGDGADSQGDAAKLRARLDALKADLGEQIAEKKVEEKSAGATRENASALAVGMRAASELVAGVIVGAGLGYLLDQQFGTKPLLLIILMVFGMAAGFVNIARLGLRPTVHKAGPAKDSGSHTDRDRR
jgi:ATP synthase protein I